MNLLRLITIFLLIICSSFVNAQTTTDGNDNSFDPFAAEKTLDSLAIKLGIENLNVQHLQNAINILTQLQQQASNCVNATHSQLSQINQRLSELTPSTTGSEKLTAEQKYLQAKSNELTTRISNCRFFLLRSEEAITAYNQTVQRLVTTELLRSEPNLFQNIIALPSASKLAYQNFNLSNFLKANGFHLFNLSFSLLLLVLLIIGTLISIMFRELIKRKLTAINRDDQFLTQVKLTLFYTLKRYLLPMILLFFITLSLATLSALTANKISLLPIATGIVIYIFLLAGIQFFIKPLKATTAPGLIRMPQTIAILLTHRLTLLASLFLIALIVYCIFNIQSIPLQIVRLSRTLFITVLTINLVSIISLINKLPRLINHHRIIRYIIAVILILCLLVIVVAEWLGYHNLSTYLLIGTSITIIAITIAWSIKNLIAFIFSSFMQSRYHWQKRLHILLGLKYEESCAEILLLKIICYLLLIISLMLALLKVWGLSQSDFRIVLKGLNQGFKLAGFVISPASIIFAALVFSILLALTRIIRTHIIHKAQLQMDQGGREALAAIIGYIGFAITLLLALLAAGVNFSGLAIIAGALSVGIGFGLQTIVNNFVSGIILLIERPIKPGDRIVVGDTEGLIRKISIRYTQIKTSLRSDVIVPNSDLVTKQVTNLTFNDLYSVLNLNISVAYGANPDQVRDILLDIAKHHPQVIHNITDYLPQVYFKSFGENAMNFIFYCSIRDVNLRSTVESDLNFLIEKRFRENQIEFAWPRREVVLYQKKTYRLEENKQKN